MSSSSPRLDAEIEKYLADSENATSPAIKAKSRRIRISTTEPKTMTAGAINKELDRLDARSSELTDRMIEDGRGNERPSDYRKKTDSLSLEKNEVADRRMRLRIEIENRYGPGAPRRLPIGKAGSR
jgi:hypothetical protein